MKVPGWVILALVVVGFFLLMVWAGPSPQCTDYGPSGCVGYD